MKHEVYFSGVNPVKKKLDNRIYFGKDGERIVIILGGGTKKRQQQDINAARAYWQDYKARKRKSK